MPTRTGGARGPHQLRQNFVFDFPLSCLPPKIRSIGFSGSARVGRGEGDTRPPRWAPGGSLGWRPWLREGLSFPGEDPGSRAVPGLEGWDELPVGPPPWFVPGIEEPGSPSSRNAVWRWPCVGLQTTLCLLPLWGPWSRIHLAGGSVSLWSWSSCRSHDRVCGCGELSPQLPEQESPLQVVQPQSSQGFLQAHPQVLLSQSSYSLGPERTC